MEKAHYLIALLLFAVLAVPAAALVCGYASGRSDVCSNSAVNAGFYSVHPDYSSRVYQSVPSACSAYDGLVRKYWEAGTGGCLAIPYAIMRTESACNPNAAGRNPGSWDCGLMQINSLYPRGLSFPSDRSPDPGNANSCFNPEANIRVAAGVFFGNRNYVSSRKAGWTLADVFCAYNAGPGNWRAGNCPAWISRYINNYNALKGNFGSSCDQFAAG